MFVIIIVRARPACVSHPRGGRPPPAGMTRCGRPSPARTVTPAACVQAALGADQRSRVVPGGHPPPQRTARLVTCVASSNGLVMVATSSPTAPPLTHNECACICGSVKDEMWVRCNDRTKDRGEACTAHALGHRRHGPCNDDSTTRERQREGGTKKTITAQGGEGGNLCLDEGAPGEQKEEGVGLGRDALSKRW